MLEEMALHLREWVEPSHTRVGRATESLNPVTDSEPVTQYV